MTNKEPETLIINPTWRGLAPIGVWALICCILAALILAPVNFTALCFMWLIIALAALVFLTIASLEIYFTHLELTKGLVSGRTGIISVQTLDEPIQHIAAVTVYQGLLARIFHFGTIGISTTSGKINFGYIPEPTAVKDQIMRLVAEDRKVHGLSSTT